MTKVPVVKPASDVRPSPRDTSAVRRTLHAYPETGFTEIRTADLLWRTLTTLGWSLRGGAALVNPADCPGLPEPDELERAAATARAQGVDGGAVDRFAGGCTAFVADLAGTRPGPCVGLRVELDALPVSESDRAEHAPAAAGFASRNAGLMHACGHDGHMAVALRLAAALAADRDFPGRVRLLFQPAEEGVRGAAAMVDAGLCDGIDVLLAIHLGFGVPKLQISPATDLYATTKLRADFDGKASHASNAPEHGRSALLAAANATIALHGLPRYAGTPTRVNVGRLNAEGAPNIISAHATLEAEVRAASAEVHADLERRAFTILHGSAAMYETEVRVVRTGHATSADSDPEVVSAVVAGVGSQGMTAGAPCPLGASDDASLMMHDVQTRGGCAAYLMVGSGDFGPNHSPTFDIHERVLPPAADLLDTAIRAGLPAKGGDEERR